MSGWICDHIGGLRTLLLGATLQGVALLLFLPFDGLVPLFVISGLFGLFQGGIVPSYAIIIREYFAPKEAGMRIGTVVMATIVGMALGGKRLNRLPFRVWVICGDSEMAEGSMWEAAEHAAFYELSNLTAIVDVNRLGQRGETMHGWDLSSYTRRFEAFGWHVQRVNGNDIDALVQAFDAARACAEPKPRIVICDTKMAKGVPFLEERERNHFLRVEPHEWREALQVLNAGRTA